MLFDELLFIRLADTINLGDFDCGDNDLNDFLLNDALKYQRDFLAVTYLFKAKNDKIAAFFSVANDSLRDQDYEKWNSLNRKIANRKRRKDSAVIQNNFYG